MDICNHINLVKYLQTPELSSINYLDKYIHTLIIIKIPQGSSMLLLNSYGLKLRYLKFQPITFPNVVTYLLNKIQHP